MLDVEFQGELAGENTSILTLSVLKGLLGAVTQEPVSYVNAPRIAEEVSLKVRESSNVPSSDPRNVITVSGSHHSVSGTLRGGDPAQPSIVGIDGHLLDISPAGCLLIVRNDDKPGKIGVVGTALGEAGVSVVNMAIVTDRRVDDATIASLRGAAGILDVHQVSGV